MYIRFQRNTETHQHLKSSASVPGPIHASLQQHRFITISATKQVSNNITYISQQRNASPDYSTYNCNLINWISWTVMLRNLQVQ